MKGVAAQYLGRLVSKENFRVYVYGSHGQRKLVQSWDEYQEHMQTGIWFATREDVVTESPKKTKKKKDVSLSEGVDKEKQDDFLSDARD